MKATRRTVLAASAALSAASLLPASARAALGNAAPRLMIDPTLPASRQLAAMAVDAGWEHALRGHDLASALYGAQAHWLAPQARLLGVTGHAGYVVAKGVAQERRAGRVQGWLLAADGPAPLPGSGPIPPDLAALARVLPTDGRAIMWISAAN